MDRGNQVCVAADEGVVADGAAELAVAVVVDRHHAAAYVDIFPKVGVADVGQVRHAGLFTQGGIFDFDKVADLDPVGQHAVRAQVAVGADAHAAAHLRLLDQGGMI